jgi:hypothetical protein
MKQPRLRHRFQLVVAAAVAAPMSESLRNVVYDANFAHFFARSRR